MAKAFNGPDRLTRLYYFLGEVLTDAAKHLTYRGGEKSPRFLTERVGDYFIFRGVFRYRHLMKRASYDEFHAYLGRRYGRGAKSV